MMRALFATLFLLVACGDDDGAAPEDASDDTLDTSPLCDTATRCARPECAEASFCLDCDDRCGDCQDCLRGDCVPKAEGAACEDGTCHAGTCCEGCWNGLTCETSGTLASCGGGDGECTECAPAFTMCLDMSCALDAHVGPLAGGEVTCIVGVEGALVCAGDNTLGQLGVSGVEQATTPIAAAIAGGFIVDADLGDGHLCVVARDGSLGCTGGNGFGQLGVGDEDDRTTVTSTGDPKMVSVSAGRAHTCAISVRGNLFCWGSNFYGQLGVGDTGARNVPTRVGIDTNWASVSVGDEHTCAVKTDGELFCFGNDAAGQLGDGMNAPRSVPTSIGTGYREVSAGAGHTCAITTSNELRCWGGNAQGQLGVGDATLRRTPTVVSGTWRSVAAGAGHTCAVKMDGTVHCFGENDDGELGRDGEGSDEAVQVAGLTGMSRALVGNDHSCAVSDAGAISCWGSNRAGQLGSAAPAARSMPGAFPP